MNNQQGQIVVESSVSLLILLSVCTTFLILMYSIYANFWLQHILQEANICYIESQNKFDCLRRAEEKTQTVLPFSKNTFNISLKDSTHEIQTKAQYKILNMKFEVLKKIKL